jgi:hypothetical protein
MINGRMYKVDWPLKGVYFNEENCGVETVAEQIWIAWCIELRKLRKVKEIAIPQSEYGGAKKSHELERTSERIGQRVWGEASENGTLRKGRRYNISRHGRKWSALR